MDTGDNHVTQGEIEAAVCEAVSHFEQEFMGRGPKAVRSHLWNDMLVIRLEGVLTAAEQHLTKSFEKENGLLLLKQVRTHLIEAGRPFLQEMIEKTTGTKVVAMHHDISTIIGEEVVIFTLDKPPVMRTRK